MAEFGDSRLENVVQYHIYDVRYFFVGTTAPNDIQETLYDILSYSQSLMDDYIWQNDSFNLRVCEGLVKSKMNKGKQAPFLQGFTNFGDNIEDEWYIVYLLLCISRRFPYVVATVRDNDGEFLLIEAADYLPKWLEPDTSDNRVFLYKGQLHIVPLPTNPSEITLFPAGKPIIDVALKILVENPGKTIALPWIQDSALKKAQEYPNKAKASFHHVLCYLPISIKYLLEKKPSLIAPAILAFINRDPLDVKTGQKLSHFSFQSTVACRVCFTKCLYGQLIKQNFIPDKSMISNLPEVSSATYKGHVIGLQLTYGFEILYAQQQASKNCVPTSTKPSGHQWEKYLNALKCHGYFKNEVVGSHLYGHLMENAKEYFSRNCLITEGRPATFYDIEKLLQDMSSDSEISTKQVNEFPPDDDESWLEISPEELESMLSQYGSKGQLNSDDVDLSNIVDGVNSFVNTTSGYQGAELPSEFSEEPEVQFDPEEFIKSVDQLFIKPGQNGRDSNDSFGEDDLSGCDGAEENDQYDQYTNAMDKELSSTDIWKSFVTMQEKNHHSDLETDDKSTMPTEERNEEGEMKPVDIDLNLVQNFLESYSLQDGMSGPVSNILNSMGISLPHRMSKTDQ